MKKKIVTQLYYYFTLFTHFNLAILFKTVMTDNSAVLTKYNTGTI
jgi:hypothetical protein